VVPSLLLRTASVKTQVVKLNVPVALFVLFGKGMENKTKDIRARLKVLFYTCIYR
jgi:hypothetical protein